MVKITARGRSNRVIEIEEISVVPTSSDARSKTAFKYWVADKGQTSEYYFDTLQQCLDKLAKEEASFLLEYVK